MIESLIAMPMPRKPWGAEGVFSSLSLSSLALCLVPSCPLSGERVFGQSFGNGNILLLLFVSGFVPGTVLVWVLVSYLLFGARDRSAAGCCLAVSAAVRCFTCRGVRIHTAARPRKRNLLGTSWCAAFSGRRRSSL